MEKLMSLQKYVRQLRPIQEKYVAPVVKVQNFISEDIDLPSDVLDGFEYTQADKSEKSRVQIKVLSPDRDTDRDEILRRLKNAGVTANTTSTNSSVDPIDGTFDGRSFRIDVKPKTGGMGESTLNSSITELFPCIAFEKKLNPKNIEDFMEKLMNVNLSSCKCIIKSDLDAAQKTVNGAEGSSKYKDKMENALGVLQFINDQHKDKPIKDVYWGYRGKPAGVPKGHPGDMFIEYIDRKMLGVSLKAGGKKTAEPQLNTYHRTIFVNKRGPSFNDKSGNEALRKIIYDKVYSKIKGMPPINNFDGGANGRHKDKAKTVAVINKLSVTDQNKYYDEYLELARQGVIDRMNKNDKQSMLWIKDAILREAPDVPTIVVKAIGSNYEEVTDRDAVGVFLPQVKFVKAYAASTKQNWVIELISGNESIKLGMTIRSSSGGKLKQWSLKVTYNGLLK
jgi:hypothetical protein